MKRANRKFWLVLSKTLKPHRRRLSPVPENGSMRDFSCSFRNRGKGKVGPSSRYESDTGNGNQTARQDTDQEIRREMETGSRWQNAIRNGSQIRLIPCQARVGYVVCVLYGWNQTVKSNAPQRHGEVSHQDARSFPYWIPKQR